MGTSPNSSLYEYAKALIQGIINHEDKMVLKELKGTSDVILELRVHDEDVGKVIGYEGRTINALRVLIFAHAKRNGDKETNVHFSILNTRMGRGKTNDKYRW